MGPHRRPGEGPRRTPSTTCVIIAPGGVTHRALTAMRRLLLEQEIICTLLVPPASTPSTWPPW